MVPTAISGLCSSINNHYSTGNEVGLYGTHSGKLLHLHVAVHSWQMLL
jgi:hypothetical protein